MHVGVLGGGKPNSGRQIFHTLKKALHEAGLLDALTWRVLRAQGLPGLARLRLGEPLKQFEMTQQARDGQRVLFASPREVLNGRSNQLYEVPVGGGFERKVMEAQAFEGTWSPDGHASAPPLVGTRVVCAPAARNIASVARCGPPCGACSWPGPRSPRRRR